MKWLGEVICDACLILESMSLFFLLAAGLFLWAIAAAHFASCQGWIGEGPHIGSPFVLFGCGGFGCPLVFFGLGGRP